MPKRFSGIELHACILVIDDIRLSRILLTHILRGLGFETIAIPSVKESAGVMPERKVDLVFRSASGKVQASGCRESSSDLQALGLDAGVPVCTIARDPPAPSDDETIGDAPVLHPPYRPGDIYRLVSCILEPATGQADATGGALGAQQPQGSLPDSKTQATTAGSGSSRIAVSGRRDEEPLLDPAALVRANAAFRLELQDFRTIDAIREPGTAADAAHRLISFACILDHPELARACQNYESAVRDERDHLKVYDALIYTINELSYRRDD